MSGSLLATTCNLAAPSNLSRRDYEFTGTIIKDASPVHDNLPISIVFYASQNGYYGLECPGAGKQFIVVSHYTRLWIKLCLPGETANYTTLDPDVTVGRKIDGYCGVRLGIYTQPDRIRLRDLKVTRLPRL